MQNERITRKYSTRSLIGPSSITQIKETNARLHPYIHNLVRPNRAAVRAFTRNGFIFVSVPPLSRIFSLPCQIRNRFARSVFGKKKSSDSLKSGRPAKRPGAIPLNEIVESNTKRTVMGNGRLNEHGKGRYVVFLLKRSRSSYRKGFSGISP